MGSPKRREIRRRSSDGECPTAANEANSTPVSLCRTFLVSLKLSSATRSSANAYRACTLSLDSEADSTAGLSPHVASSQQYSRSVLIRRLVYQSAGLKNKTDSANRCTNCIHMSWRRMCANSCDRIMSNSSLLNPEIADAGNKIVARVNPTI